MFLGQTKLAQRDLKLNDINTFNLVAVFNWNCSAFVSVSSMYLTLLMIFYYTYNNFVYPVDLSHMIIKSTAHFGLLKHPFVNCSNVVKVGNVNIQQK